MKLCNDLNYIATLFFYDGPIESVLYDEKFDNYYLCMISGNERNSDIYVFFHGEKEDFSLLLTTQISQNEFIRRSKFRFYATINSHKSNIVNITFRENVPPSDLHRHLYYDEYAPLTYSKSITELPMNDFLKYLNFKITGKGLSEFISCFDLGI